MNRLAPLILLALAGCTAPVAKTVAPIAVTTPYKGSAESWLDKAVKAYDVADRGDDKKGTTVNSDELYAQLAKAWTLYPQGIPPASMRPSDKLFRASFEEIHQAARLLKVADLEDPNGDPRSGTEDVKKHYDHAEELATKAMEQGEKTLDGNYPTGDVAFVYSEGDLKWVMSTTNAQNALEKALKTSNKKFAKQQLDKAVALYPKGIVPKKERAFDTLFHQSTAALQNSLTALTQAEATKQKNIATQFLDKAASLLIN